MNTVLKWVAGIVIALALLTLAIFVWPVPQLGQAYRDAQTKEIVDHIAEELENPSTEAPAATEASVAENKHTPANGADSLVCPYPDAEVAFSDIGSPVTLRGRNEDNTYVYVEDPEGHLGWLPMNAMWVNGAERRLKVEEIATLTVVSSECPKAEESSVESATSQSQEVISGEYLVPGDFAMLPNGNGVSYSVATEGPFDVYSSYGQTVIMAAGNLTVDGKYVYTTDKKGTVGNLHVFICDEKSGCKNTLTGYKAGHVRVTIVDGGTEVPNESVAWAVNFMLTGGGNCGNKCLTVYVGYSDNTKDEFKSEVEASAIKLTEVAKPYPTYKPVTENPVPSGASVLPGAEGPTGHSFYLSESPSYTTIPETGGIVVLCAVETDINGKTYPANTAVVFVGKTDGKTPADLNGTAKITVDSNPAMVMVYVFYDTDMTTATADLREKYADWTWVE